jgi:hypothetical protein
MDGLSSMTQLGKMTLGVLWEAPLGGDLFHPIATGFADPSHNARGIPFVPQGTLSISS